MHLEATINPGLHQIKIKKQAHRFSSLITIKDAQKFWEEGRVTKYNKIFARLADNDFDVQATLAYYRNRAK